MRVTSLSTGCENCKVGRDSKIIHFLARIFYLYYKTNVKAHLVGFWCDNVLSNVRRMLEKRVKNYDNLLTGETKFFLAKPNFSLLRMH